MSQLPPLPPDGAQFDPPPPPVGVPFETPPPAQPGNGLAIASMVLGIASFVFGVTAIAGLILGIISLARKSAGRGFAIAGVACSAVCLLAYVALMVAILVPGLGHAKELAKQAKCSMQLNAIGKAVIMYQSDNNEQFPPDLNTLVRAGQPSELLRCPSATEKGRACDYLYAPPPADAPLSTVIACELAGNHKDGSRNVLHADGRVESMRSEPAFQALMAQPENADFAATLRQAETPSAK